MHTRDCLAFRHVSLGASAHRNDLFGTFYDIVIPYKV